MAKWQFSYSTSDGKRGHLKVTANSKIDAIKKGMEHARKHAAGASINFDCKLAQA